MQPIYKERRLIRFYLDECKRLTETGDMTYMLSKDKKHLTKYSQSLLTSSKYRSLNAGHWELRANWYLVDACRYHKLVLIQGAVVAHVSKCYSIRYDEAQKIKHEAKEEGTPFYLLQEDKYCSFPPKPKLDHIFAIKEDEGSNIFDSDEEEDEDDDNVDELYANEPKADA